MTEPQAFSGSRSFRSEFIRAMRGVASSVTVVTTDGWAGRYGATVSAFCSVSADPPSLLVCLRADSRIARLVEANRSFCVNVLSQAHRDIAERFAGFVSQAGEDRFSNVDCYRAREHPAPIISDSTALSCDLSRVTLHGSHLVVFGDVVRIEAGDREPLTYLRGSYHRLVPSVANPTHRTQT